MHENLEINGMATTILVMPFAVGNLVCSSIGIKTYPYTEREYGICIHKFVCMYV